MSIPLNRLTAGTVLRVDVTLDVLDMDFFDNNRYYTMKPGELCVVVAVDKPDRTTLTLLLPDGRVGWRSMSTVANRSSLVKSS